MFEWRKIEQERDLKNIVSNISVFWTSKLRNLWIICGVVISIIVADLLGTYDLAHMLID